MLLDFHMVDDLGLAASRGRCPEVGEGILTSDELGPVVELALMGKGEGVGLPGLRALQSSPITKATADLFSGVRLSNITSDVIGSIAVKSRLERDWDDRWTAFLYWAQRAAEKAGLQKRIAQQLVGAIGELEDNIHIHSQAVDTGFVGYRAGDGEFEFVIADSGVGVLDSLKTCPEYSHLSDSGQALMLALRDGESRFGHQARRGCGFRPIFTGLANLRGSLRFRSGDHVLVIDGQSPDLTMARLHQRSHFRGLAASVICRGLR